MDGNIGNLLRNENPKIEQHTSDTFGLPLKVIRLTLGRALLNRRGLFHFSPNAGTAELLLDFVDVGVERAMHHKVDKNAHKIIGWVALDRQLCQKE